MTVFGHDRVLNGCILGPDVPLHDVARLSTANDDVWLKRIEHGLCNLILAGEGHFGSSFQIQREDVDQAIWLVKSVLRALAVTDQEQLGVSRVPVHRSHHSFDLDVGLEHELMGQLFSLALLRVLILVVFFHEEVSNNVELLVQSPFHDPTCLVHELTEYLGTHLGFGILF